MFVFLSGMPVLFSFKCVVWIISLWCQCLLKVTFSLSALWYYVQRLYFPTILLRLCIFYGIKNQFQRQHSYRGKTSQQCEVDNASCIWEGSIKLACHPPYCQAWLCPPQRCVPRCPLLTIWLATSHLPSHCICGQHFTVEHAPICTHGGFPPIRHNELRDMMAVFLTEVWHNVGIEPPLQPLTGEHLTLRSANRNDGAHLDISADNPWGRDRTTHFLT